MRSKIEVYPIREYSRQSSVTIRTNFQMHFVIEHIFSLESELLGVHCMNAVDHRLTIGKSISLCAPWLFSRSEMWVIDQTPGQDGWMLAKFVFACLWIATESTPSPQTR